MTKEKQEEWKKFWRETFGDDLTDEELQGVDLDYVE